MNIYVILMNLKRQFIVTFILVLIQIEPGYSKFSIDTNLDAGLTATVRQDTPALSALKKRFNDGFMYRADLSHQFTDGYTGETTSSYGSIWFTKDSYKIDTPDQIILVSNRVSTVFNKQQKKVILSTYHPEEDDFAPSRYFSGDIGQYESREEPNSDGSTTITITTTDSFDVFKEVVIRVSKDGTPIQIDAIDQMDNTVRTTFRFGRFERTDQTIFVFKTPEGVEIVDMRQ